MRLLPLLLALELLGAATAIPNPAGASDPEPSTVDPITHELIAPNGDVVVTFPASGVDVTVVGRRKRGMNSFLGIPYAQPPVGDLRFAAPRAAQYSGTVNASITGPACMQPAKGYAAAVGVSEDCLTLNIVVPESKEPVPVLVWIHGGGYFMGSGGEFASGYISEFGRQIDHPFALVTINYRLGIFGFGYGEEMKSRGAMNNGLRDQRLALQWVKRNIGAFGGDPERVTVMGESAGGMSISLLMLDESEALFQAAIMQSGVGSRISMQDPGPEEQVKNYEAVAAQAGCSGNSTSSTNGTSANSTSSNSTSSTDGASANSTSSNSTSTDSTNANGTSANSSDASGIFDCLREADAERLLAASQAQSSLQTWLMFGPKVDGDVVPDDPVRMWYAGRMKYVPLITGNVMDEGTLFVSPEINGTEAIVSGYLTNFTPSEQQDILKAYPDDPAKGSPFDTGDDTFGASPSYKQASAIVGDMLFQADRRQFIQLANAHGLNQTWSYLFNMHSPTFPNRTGVAHSSDVAFTFGQVKKEDGFSNDAVDLADEMMARWIYFTYYQDPNSRKGKGGPVLDWWPTYESNRTICVWQDNSNCRTDDYRGEMQVFYLKDPSSSSPDSKQGA